MTTGSQGIAVPRRPRENRKTVGEAAVARRCWYMIRRRAADADLETAIGCHTFRATGITDYLTNGGRIEVAQRMSGHATAKTTGLYDRRNDDISVGKLNGSESDGF
jgi:integrase